MKAAVQWYLIQNGIVLAIIAVLLGNISLVDASSDKDDNSITLSLLCEINKQRQKAGLSNLVPYGYLISSSGMQSEYQNKIKSMTHDNPSSPFADRLKRLGFEYSAISENVCFNAASPKQAVRLWMNSPPHRRNMLNPSSIYFGGSKRGAYWTTEFGAPTSQSEARQAKSNAVLCPSSIPDYSTGSVYSTKNPENYQSNTDNNSYSVNDSGQEQVSDPSIRVVEYARPVPAPRIVVKPVYHSRPKHGGQGRRVVRVVRY